MVVGWWWWYPKVGVVPSGQEENGTRCGRIESQLGQRSGGLARVYGRCDERERKKERKR